MKKKKFGLLSLLLTLIFILLAAYVPENYRDIDNEWFGLTKHARLNLF